MLVVIVLNTLAAATREDFSEYYYMEEGLDENGNRVMQFWNDNDKKDMQEVPYEDAFIKRTFLRLSKLAL